MQQNFATPGAVRMLHFAPEPPLRERLRGWGLSSYSTCDLRAPDVDHHVDIQKLPFDDARFDLIVCSHILEHVHDDRAAMRELHRVCSGTGTVLIAVPFDRSTPTREDLSPSLSPRDRKRLFGEPDHLRVYGPDLRARLEQAGFLVGTYEPVRDATPSECDVEGLGPEQVLFICTRA
jgi:SAM-dependent methyltransferase